MLAGLGLGQVRQKHLCKLRTSHAPGCMLCRRGVIWGCTTGEGRLAAVAAATAAGCDDAAAWGGGLMC